MAKNSPKAMNRAQVLNAAVKLGMKDEAKRFNEAKKNLGDLICEDVGFWYEQAKDLALNADTDHVRQLAVKMILDKFAPDQKETIRREVFDESMATAMALEAQAAKSDKVVFKIYGTNRGTKQARDEAIEVKARRLEGQKSASGS